MCRNGSKTMDFYCNTVHDKRSALFLNSAFFLFLLIRSNIFYRACIDIPRGTELLVWYNDSYTSFFGIPLQCIAQDENCKFLLYFFQHKPEFLFHI